VAKAIAVYQQENAQIDWQYWAMLPPAESTVAAVPTAPPEEEKADIAFKLWTGGVEMAANQPQSASSAEVSDSSPAADATPASKTTPEKEPKDTLLASSSKVSLQVPKTLIRLAESVVGEAPATVSSQSEASLLPGFIESSESLDVVAQKPQKPAPNPIEDNAASPVFGENPVWEAPNLAEDTTTPAQLPQPARDQETLPTANPSTPKSIQETSSAQAYASTEKAEPTWAETREKHQSMAPVTPSASSGEGQASLGNESAEDGNSLTGAFPETRVIPPLREDFEPVALPSITKAEQGASNSHSDDRAIANSHPLPEGLRARLRARAEADNDQPSPPLKSLQDQVTEAVLELDLPTLPGLE
jgi:hypothetical protein